jgi:hypothetical protein
MKGRKKSQRAILHDTALDPQAPASTRFQAILALYDSGYTKATRREKTIEQLVAKLLEDHPKGHTGTACARLLKRLHSEAVTKPAEFKPPSAEELAIQAEKAARWRESCLRLGWVDPNDETSAEPEGSGDTIPTEDLSGDPQAALRIIEDPKQPALDRWASLSTLEGKVPREHFRRLLAATLASVGDSQIIAVLTFKLACLAAEDRDEPHPPTKLPRRLLHPLEVKVDLVGASEITPKPSNPPPTPRPKPPADLLGAAGPTGEPSAGASAPFAGYNADGPRSTAAPAASPGPAQSTAPPEPGKSTAQEVTCPAQPVATKPAVPKLDDARDPRPVFPSKMILPDGNEQAHLVRLFRASFDRRLSQSERGKFFDTLQRAGMIGRADTYAFHLSLLASWHHRHPQEKLPSYLPGEGAPERSVNPEREVYEFLRRQQRAANESAVVSRGWDQAAVNEIDFGVPFEVSPAPTSRRPALPDPWAGQSMSEWGYPLRKKSDGQPVDSTASDLRRFLADVASGRDPGE